MKCLHADFARCDDAARAVADLAEQGVPRSSMELYSPRPVEAHPAPLPRPSRMSLIAVLSAITFGGGATLLMYWIQRDYPLVTGGMPINSGWATGVVTFETTMAGAVFGIFAALLWEAGLLRRRGPVPQLPDEGAVLQIKQVTKPDQLKARLPKLGASTVEVISDES